MNGIEFENKIITILEKQNRLRGYGLFGYQLPLEIDGLLLLEPGIFVCYEAKCYNGTWTGDANNPWKSDDVTIKSGRTNPNHQVQHYTLEVKDRLGHLYLFNQEKNLSVRIQK